MTRVLFALSLLFLTWAPTALGATYDVDACRYPDGSPAPAGGWKPFASVAGVDSSRFETVDSCARGGGLVATLDLDGGGGTNAVAAGWGFAAPDDTSIAGFVVHRSVVLAGSAAEPTSWEYRAFAGDSARLATEEQCTHGGSTPECPALGAEGEPFADANLLDRHGTNGHLVVLMLTCADPQPEGRRCVSGFTGPRLTIFGATMTLEDSSSPVLDADPLKALSSRPVTGTVSVAFSATDRGSGVRSASLSVDGREAAAWSGGDVDPKCAAPYVAAVPCPLLASGALRFDTTSVADGVHTLTLTVRDAAGNKTSSGAATIVVRNHAGAPNGPAPAQYARLAAWFAGTSHRGVRTLAYGGEAKIEGRLTTAAGDPVRDAELDVSERPIGAETLARRSARVTTDTDGRFAYRASRGPSRVITLGYTPYAGDPGPAAVAHVTVYVRAGVTLAVTPRRVRNGSVIRFTGRVRGERGTRRAIVTIYALSGGPRRRIPVETVRASADGRFSYRYRFRSIPAPTTYRFEARLPKQTGFPYVEGVSPEVSVRGRP